MAAAREAQVKAGPRGLGVSIGLGVDDLDAAYRWCRESGCEITSEPRDEPYGDRVFEFIDRDGYLWEILAANRRRGDRARRTQRDS